MTGRTVEIGRGGRSRGNIPGTFRIFGSMPGVAAEAPGMLSTPGGISTLATALGGNRAGDCYRSALGFVSRHLLRWISRVAYQYGQRHGLGSQNPDSQP